MEHYTWDEMEKEVLSSTIARKIVTGDKAMVAQVFLAKGGAPSRERADHIHFGRRAEVRAGGQGSSGAQGRGATYPIERPASRSGTGGYAGSGHIFADPGGLAYEERFVFKARGTGKAGVGLTGKGWFGVIKKPSSIVPR